MRLPKHNPALIAIDHNARNRDILSAAAIGGIVANLPDALRAARRLELQLEQEKAKVRQLKSDLSNVKRQREHDLVRMTGMIEPPQNVSFADQAPDMIAPVPMMISLAQSAPPNVWGCPKCGRTFGRQIWADNCMKGHAPKPCACGETIRYDNQTKCEACQLLDRLRSAKQVPEAEYEGWVHSDHLSGYNDGFFDSVDDFRKAWDDADGNERWGKDVPCYVWACKDEAWNGIDLERALENELSDHHKDAADQIVDEDELWAFVEAWNKKQSIVTYWRDQTRVVVLDQARFDVLIGG